MPWNFVRPCQAPAGWKERFFFYFQSRLYASQVTAPCFSCVVIAHAQADYEFTMQPPHQSRHYKHEPPFPPCASLLKKMRPQRLLTRPPEKLQENGLLDSITNSSTQDKLMFKRQKASQSMQTSEAQQNRRDTNDDAGPNCARKTLSLCLKIQ